MKKTALVVLGMFVLGSFSFAAEGKPGGEQKQMTPEQKAKLEAVKKERAEYFKNLQTLIDKYNAASAQGKVSVKKEITAFILNQTNKDLAAKKDMILVKNSEIAQIESDKNAYVNKKVDYFISQEGQAKLKESQNKGNKDAKPAPAKSENKPK